MLEEVKGVDKFVENVISVTAYCTIHEHECFALCAVMWHGNLLSLIVIAHVAFHHPTD